jgi:hypothetical protein
MTNRRTEIEARLAAIAPADRTPRQAALVEQAERHADAVARTAAIDAAFEQD